MNILLVTNNLYATGGDWTYIKSISDLYKSKGHNVFLFGLKKELNLDKTYQEYYVSFVDLHEAKMHKIANAFKVLSKSIYSKESQEKIGIFLDTYQIDIVQLNSIHFGITPSIIRTIKSKGIPIVWRMIDYYQICPNFHLMHHNILCEECLGNKFYNCIKNNCKDSILTSFITSFEAYFYYWRKDYTLIDKFSFQNHYMQQLFLRSGYKESQTFVQNNPYDVTSIDSSYLLGDYVLFFGRLEQEKGILTFLKAAKLNPGIKHIVVGTGNLDKQVQEEIQHNQLYNVEFVGPVWGVEMDKIIKECRFVVVPSEWQEPSGYVILQSFANLKPVIASKRGGMLEIVKENKNGLLFEAKNVEELANKIMNLYNDTEKVKEMGEYARKTVELEFSTESYYEVSIALFNELIIKNS